MNRRDWLSISATVGGGALVWSQLKRKFEEDLRPLRSRVTVLHADAYSENLDQLLFDGIRLFNLGLRGRSVLLKPNLVEYIPGKPVNTDPRLVGAAAEAFLRLGAVSVEKRTMQIHGRLTWPSRLVRRASAL